MDEAHFVYYMFAVISVGNLHSVVSVGVPYGVTVRQGGSLTAA